MWGTYLKGYSRFICNGEFTISFWQKGRIPDPELG